MTNAVYFTCVMIEASFNFLFQVIFDYATCLINDFCYL